MPNVEPVKRLAQSQHREILDMNKARRSALLSPLEVRIRRCISCRALFESTGNRQCGCSGKTNSASIGGREIL